jgi:hypothetical protein
MPTYPSQEIAEARAEALKRIGIWPAVIAQADGRFRLSTDFEGVVDGIAADLGVPNTRRGGRSQGYRDRRQARGQR